MEIKMTDYEITDFELNGAKKIVSAQGVAEAMFEYLPWPKLDITINFDFTNPWEVIDNQTDFKYLVEAQK